MCGNGLESGGINAHSGKEYIQPAQEVEHSTR